MFYATDDADNNRSYFTKRAVILFLVYAGVT